MSVSQHSEPTVLCARYLVDQEGEVREDAAVEIADGTVRSVGEPADYDGDRRVDLGDVALVAGRVNAHSHAFQRAIRGRTEYLEAGRTEDDFWSWREKMYRAALALDADAFEAVARFAFLEMLRAGFTTVGEFHYVHHDPDGEPYANPNELAERAIRAAESVGIRIELLRAAYHRAGYDADPNPRQRRFTEPELDVYLRRFDELAEVAEKRPLVGVGLAPHSIRAVPRHWLEGIAAYADEHDLPVHIHASEQRGELEESLAEYGTTPIELFDEIGLLSDRLTIIHATHATDREIELMARRGSTVCACPTTERNLGDGFLPAEKLAERDVPICLGSDSHANIDPWEEMRLVEYHERLRRERRNVLAGTLEEADDRRFDTARVLWPMSGANGARALGRRPAGFQRGAPADFTAIDLGHVALAGTSEESLLADLAFSIPTDAVRDVFVAGERVIADGDHADGSEMVTNFERALRSV